MIDKKLLAVTEAVRDKTVNISVVICALNEEESLPGVLRRIPSFVKEVIVVDGNSTDRTIEVAKAAYPGITIITQPGRGKGEAIRCGLKKAGGDIIVTMDADGTTDPDEMHALIEPLFHGYDIVKGSRFRKGFPKGMPKHRIFGNIVLAVAAGTLFLYPFTDICSGYVALWRRTLPKLTFVDDGKPSDVESVLYLRAAKRGLRLKEVGHTDRGRQFGNSKMPSFREGWNNIKIILKERLTA